MTPLTTGMLEPDLQPTDNSSEKTTENTAPSEPDKGEIVDEPSAEKTETPEEKNLNNIPEQPVADEPSEFVLDINAGRYFVQAGAFPNEKMALERKEKIDFAFNYPTGIIIEDGYYKLRLGYFAIKADARSCYNELIDNNFEAFIGIKKN
ncbi:MAG: SPOR domain-containing protein [Sphingobacteriia bacterium]|nr:SPOR domain-containing protein [Sphingobacteriia bacterium]